MNQESTDRILKYEELKLKIKELELEATILAEIILEEVPHDTEIELKQGKLAVASRDKWTYSHTLIMLEKDVKARQRDEQMRGIATQEKGKPYLIYRTNKDE